MISTLLAASESAIGPTLAVIVGVGMAAQWVGWRTQVPSIILLLVSGLLLGPVLGVVDPDELLGGTLFPIVSLSVALILFEAGLDLPPREPRATGSVVRRLISIGAIITFLVAIWGAERLFDISRGAAAVMAAVLVATGPKGGRPTPPLRPSEWPHRPDAARRGHPHRPDRGHRVAHRVRGGTHERHGRGAQLGAARGGAHVGGRRRDRLHPRLRARPRVPALPHPRPSGQPDRAGDRGRRLRRQQRGARRGRAADGHRDGHLARPPGVRCCPTAARVQRKPADAAHLGTVHPARSPHRDRPAPRCRAPVDRLPRPAGVRRPPAGDGRPDGEKSAVVARAAVPDDDGTPGHRGGRGVGHLRHPVGGRGCPRCRADRAGRLPHHHRHDRLLRVHGRPGRPSARLAEARANRVLIVGAHSIGRGLAKALSDLDVKTMLVDTDPYNVTRSVALGLPARRLSVLTEEATHGLDLRGIGRIVAMTSNDEVNALTTSRFARLFGRRETFQLAPSEKRRNGAPPEDLLGRIVGIKGLDYATLDERSRQGWRVRASTADGAIAAAAEADTFIPIARVFEGQLSFVCRNDAVPSQGTVLGLAAPAVQQELDRSAESPAGSP